MTIYKSCVLYNNFPRWPPLKKIDLKCKYWGCTWP